MKTYPVILMGMLQLNVWVMQFHLVMVLWVIWMELDT